ncbi:hypothetical protein [Mesotoga prima]|uniref:hypothetical protein n=1 Tax=Mesotoga prima TaxID=1184387 RepID=UPI002FD8CA63
MEDDGTLTGVGETVLFDCIAEIKTEQVNADRFDEIWLLFPRDDSFKSFSKTRLIRSNKPKAKEEYFAAIARGATHEQLIASLQNEINYRSSSDGENLFKYMRSPVNWFKLDTYLDYEETENVREDYGKQLF